MQAPSPALRKPLLLLPLALCLAIPAAGQPAVAPPAPPRIVIDYYFEPGCDECRLVRRDILPELELRFEGLYVLNWLDIGVRTNYLRLASEQERLGIRGNEPICMIVDGRRALNGFRAIQTGLFHAIDERIGAQLDAAGIAAPGTPAPLPPEAAADTVRGRVRRFTAWGVAVAGLVDGINPCAISTLVFFLSLLAVSKVSGPRLLAVGVSFCVGSFLTYTAIGFGLLRVLHLLERFDALRRIVDGAMVVVLAAFALLSFLDAIRYAVTRDPHDVVLQLSMGLRQRMHRVMHQGLASRSLALGGLAIGSGVTAIESVCTGQVYVPALAFVARSGPSGWRALLLLLLYNLMFVAPLAVVFGLAYRGIKAARLLQWSRLEAVLGKLLLGVFFVVLLFLLMPR